MSEYECPKCHQLCSPQGHGPGVECAGAVFPAEMTGSYLLKTDKNGNTSAMDLMPVESFESLLEGRIKARQFFKHDEEQFRLLDRMSAEQLRYLVPILAHKVEYYARLWSESFKPEHTEFVEKLRRVREIAKDQGIDLWPELEGKAK